MVNAWWLVVVALVSSVISGVLAFTYGARLGADHVCREIEQGLGLGWPEQDAAAGPHRGDDATSEARRG